MSNSSDSKSILININKKVNRVMGGISRYGLRRLGGSDGRRSRRICQQEDARNYFLLFSNQIVGGPAHSEHALVVATGLARPILLARNREIGSSVHNPCELTPDAPRAEYRVQDGNTHLVSLVISHSPHLGAVHAGQNSVYSDIGP